MAFSEYMSGIITWLFEFVRHFGALSVFFIVILEEMFIPLPSPLVIMGAGFILIPAGIPLQEALVRIVLFIVIPASIASTIGSFFAYGIGYYGGKPLINRFHNFLGMSWKDVQKYEKKLEQGRKVWTTIIICRAIPFFPIAVVSVASGVLRLSWKKYAVCTFIGSVPRVFVLGFLGWYFGSSYVSIASRFSDLGAVIEVVLVGIILFLLYHYRHHAKHHAARLVKHAKKHYKRIRKRSFH